MKKSFALLLMVGFSALSLFGQHQKVQSRNADFSENAGHRNGPFEATLFRESGHSPIKAKWAASVRPTFARNHYSPEIVALKEAKMQEKLATLGQGEELFENSRAVTPLLGQNMEGNWSVVGTPPDNSMAISNGGFIVSANNDGLEYHNAAGQFLYVDFWADFINDPSLTGMIYDPKVIYDSQSDRFVLVVLHGSTAATSKVLVCFSKTNNPMTGGGWWIYNLSGNPLNNDCWFDYPCLGVSNNEIYVTGNLFTSGANNFNQAIIYQISKAQGFAGGVINFDVWSGLSNSPIAAFTLVPASFGQQGNYGPGIYFVSNAAGGDNKIRLWDLTNDLGSNPQLNVTTVTTTAYSPAAPALQSGTADQLDNGDCRIQNAFFLNGIIHFTFCSDAGSGWNGINYNRLTVANNTNQSVVFGQVGTADLCYPAVASFATTATDKSVMLAFLRATQGGFPEVRVINCDDVMQFSNTTLVKAGETFVNFLSGGPERWGDYTGISRRHNSTDARIWLAGCYGANISGAPNTWKTWISEIFAQGGGGTAPIANFIGNPASGNAPLSVNFTDSSTNSPTGWTWSFPGGSPASSGSQNPSVTYNTPGTYSVTLTSQNAFGSDAETKTNYIVVDNPSGAAPVANFVGNPTFGNAPMTVNFTDLSTNSPTSRSWSFPGGNPNTSSAANPSITYSTPGLYTITLTVGNAAGSDTHTKTNYVQVNSGVGLEEIDLLDGGSKIYPNPVVDLMHVLFNMDTPEEVTIEVIDNNGRIVKLLYRDVPRRGENRLTFNKGALSSGTYFVSIRTNKQILKNEKVIIAD